MRASVKQGAVRLSGLALKLCDVFALTPRRAGRFIICLLILFFPLMSATVIPVQSPAPEYQVKAIFLFNFAKFVTWPDKAFVSQDSPFVIGVFGTNPFGSFLEETVKDERIDNHPLIIQYFGNEKEITTCHILFIQGDQIERMNKLLPLLNAQHILTVGDINSFTKNGGMIRLYTEDNKTKMRINLGAAKDADLVISSKLLRLAEVVEYPNN